MELNDLEKSMNSCVASRFFARSPCNFKTIKAEKNSNEKLVEVEEE